MEFMAAYVYFQHYLVNLDISVLMKYLLLLVFYRSFVINSYASVEFNILAVMGYDRFVAICHPLHYHQLMSQGKVCALIAFSLDLCLCYFWSLFHINCTAYILSQIHRKAILYEF